MSVVVPDSFGIAAYHFTAGFGTPDFVCTLAMSVYEPSTHVAAANAAFVAYTSSFQNELSSQYTLDHVSLYIGAGDDPSGSVDSTIDPHTGTRSGAGEAVAMAAIMRKQTASLGRKGRGRNFWPGLLNSADVSATGNIDPTRLATLNGAADDFYDALAGVSDPGALAPFLLHSDGTTPPTAITGFEFTSLVGWIRGRVR